MDRFDDFQGISHILQCEVVCLDRDNCLIRCS